MGAKRKLIDVEDHPDLICLVDDLRNPDGEVVIRQHGEEIAVVIPIRGHVPKRARRVITDEDRAAFRAAFGAWKDVDTDRLLKDIYADRDMSIERGEMREVPDR
jgi:hypothetical protein